MIVVTAVEPLADYTLCLTFYDGSERVVDLADELWGPMGDPLRDLAYFRQVRVDPGPGVWLHRRGRFCSAYMVKLAQGSDESA